MSISLLFAGDFVPYGRTVALFEKNKYYELFHDLYPLLRKVDYSIINYESPIITENYAPIDKSGPILFSSSKAMEVIHNIGFDMITLANNHFRDLGQKGVEKTIDSAESLKIEYVGGGANYSEARKIKYVEIKNKTIAFINVCENEWSIARKDYGGSNPYDLINIHHDIVEAKQKSDYVILVIHGGIEHYQLPTPRMKREYRYFVELGADAVINHHQHCYSGYEIYCGKPIFYGLGNFCFDRLAYRNNGLWDKGILVELVLGSTGITHKIYPYQQCLTLPEIKLLANDSFSVRINELNKVIANDYLLENEYKKWADKHFNKFISQLNAFGFKLFDKIYKRGLIWDLTSKKRLYVILDLLRCESHIDVIKRSLINKINK